jgi:hypothetical protein
MPKKNRIWAKKFRLPLNLASGGVIEAGDRREVVGFRGALSFILVLGLFLSSVLLFIFVVFAKDADFMLRILGSAIILFGVEYFSYALDARLKFLVLAPPEGFDYYVFYTTDEALEAQLERIIQGKVGSLSMLSFWKNLLRWKSAKKTEVNKDSFDIMDADKK